MYDSQITYSIADFLTAFIGDNFLVNLTQLGFVLFIGVPLIMLIYSCIKILFNIKTQNRIVRISAFTLWIVGLVLMIYVGAHIGSDFKENATYAENNTLKNSASQVMHLNLMKDSTYNFNERFGYQSRVRIDNWNLVKVNEKGISFGFPKIDVEKGENDSFQVVVVKEANGFTNKAAIIRARSIQYDFNQNDSVINFSPYFDIVKEDKWRNQSVRVILKVPVGKTIYLNSNMRNIINDIQNISDTWDGDMVDRRWIMTDQGLKCVDCEGLNEHRDENRERKHHIHINKDGTTIDIDTDSDNWDSLDVPPPPAPPAPPVKGIKKV